MKAPAPGPEGTAAATTTLHQAELGAFLEVRHTAYDLVVCADALPTATAVGQTTA